MVGILLSYLGFGLFSGATLVSGRVKFATKPSIYSSSPLPTRTAPPPNPVAPSPRTTMAPRVTSPRTCPQKAMRRRWFRSIGGSTTGTKNEGERREVRKTKRSWGCRRVVFWKKTCRFFCFEYFLDEFFYGSRCFLLYVYVG